LGSIRRNVHLLVSARLGRFLEMKVWGEPPQQRRSRRHDRTIRPLVDGAWPGLRSPVDPGPFEADPGVSNAAVAVAPGVTGVAVVDPIDPIVPAAPSIPRVHLTGNPGRDAIALGTAALLDLGQRIGPQELADPIMAAAYRFARSRGERVQASQLLAAYNRRSVQSSGADRGLPWTFPEDGGPGSPLYARASGQPAHWRPRDAERLASDPGAYARWLVEPIAQVQTLELLAELGETSNPKGEAAAPIRRDLLPQVEARFALHVAADDPWRDLFALWQLTSAPHTLNDLWFLATAIAYRYATMARRVAGPVIGRGSFEGEQLVSASAALGTVLWQLRIYPSLVPELVDHVADKIRSDGGWGDPGQPTDILTTLAAADLLLGLDPDFDPDRTVVWFARAQEPEGWWRALDPEVPWLTAAVVEWLDRSTRPFVQRFSWPGALKLDLDRRTQLPTYAWFADLARSVQEVPGLARAEWDIAFVDLAGFGTFNTDNGQAKGDEVIGAFGRALARIPGCRAIRDGGDEFILIGAPGDSSLFDLLDAFRKTWLAEFVRTFGPEPNPVRPRITVSRSVGRELAAGRERLGRRIGEMKKLHENPPRDGVIERS
jgi:GGDEF domain-containing protein